MISAAALCFCLFNILQFLLNYNKTAQTVGTIISIKTPGPETSKFRNSKWAVVSYKVKGRIYQSHNRIQVPVSSQIGSTVTVRYDKFTPEKLYSYSMLRIVVSFIIAAVFFVIARFESFCEESFGLHKKLPDSIYHIHSVHFFELQC